MSSYTIKIVHFIRQLRWWQWLLLGYILMLPLALHTTSLFLHAANTVHISQKSSPASMFAITDKLTTPTPTPVPITIPAVSASTQNHSSHINPSPTLSPTNTPTPRDTTPPVIQSMTGPENGSTIHTNNFCFPMYIVDNVTRNSQVQVQFDSNTWSGWSTNVSPCYSNIASGSHTFSAQAKDDAGNLSAVTTRTFTVMVPQNIPVTIQGSFYSDDNCNDTQDAGETILTGVTTTVNLFLMPQFSLAATNNSNANGTYSISSSVQSEQSSTFQISLVAPSGYKVHRNAPTVTLSSTNTTASVDFPFVPADKIGLCSQ